VEGGQEVKIAVVVATYNIYSTSNLQASPAVAPKRLASPAFHASIRAEDNFRPMVVARCLETYTAMSGC
jgi:hypothetical protein